MSLEFIHDEKGEKKAVIIPIKKWKIIEKQLENQKQKKSFDPSHYRGVLNLEEGEIKKEVKRLREEWERFD